MKTIVLSLNHAEQRKEELLQLDEDIREMKLENERNWKEFQSCCPHSQGSIFHEDPSGNNDSWNECKLCGKAI